MGALRNYESGAVALPDARALYQYMAKAELAGWEDLAKVFRTALLGMMGAADRPGDLAVLKPVNELEHLILTATLATFRGQGPYRKHQKRLFNALKEPVRLTAKEYSFPPGVSRFPYWRAQWVDSPDAPGHQTLYSLTVPKVTRRSK